MYTWDYPHMAPQISGLRCEVRYKNEGKMIAHSSVTGYATLRY